MDVVLLAHEQFPDHAKTAIGILRYGDYDVTAVLDREKAGSNVSDHVSNVQDAPIVSGMDDVTEAIDALVIGISPIGGGFDESWRLDIRSALERGCDVISGLHYFLESDDEFSALASEYNCDLWDVRKPHEDLTIASGTANSVDASVVLTVGTDCSTGKMTTSMELARTAQNQGVDATVIPTGQTGIMIEGWGNPIDRVISDFAAGAVEEMILEKGDDHDLLIVEGQGSIVHPAYSGVTTAILHGAMPDKLVLCHVASRTAIRGYENVQLPSPETYVELYETLAEPVHKTEITAGALATHHIANDDDARNEIDAFSRAINCPVTDPVRFDPDVIIDSII